MERREDWDENNRKRGGRRRNQRWRDDRRRDFIPNQAGRPYYYHPYPPHQPWQAPTCPPSGMFHGYSGPMYPVGMDMMAPAMALPMNGQSPMFQSGMDMMAPALALPMNGQSALQSLFSHLLSAASQIPGLSTTGAGQGTPAIAAGIYEAPGQGTPVAAASRQSPSVVNPAIAAASPEAPDLNTLSAAASHEAPHGGTPAIASSRHQTPGHEGQKAGSDVDLIEEESEESDADFVMIAGNSSKCGIYLPGQAKPDDLDGDIDEKKSSKPSVKGKGKGKKQSVHKATLERLRVEAEKLYGKKGTKATSVKSVPQTQGTKKCTRSSNKMKQLPGGDNQIEALLKMEGRVGRTLAAAYSRARSTEQDEGDIRALKAAGVLLPNGFTPLGPMYLEEGELMLEQYSSE